MSVSSVSTSGTSAPASTGTTPASGSAPTGAPTLPESPISTNAIAKQILDQVNDDRNTNVSRVVSMNNTDVWDRDPKTGVFFIVHNNKKIYNSPPSENTTDNEKRYQDYMEETQKCFGTGLGNKNSNMSCKKVMQQCVVDSNFGECVKMLNTVPKEEIINNIKSTDPKIIKKILKTLGYIELNGQVVRSSKIMEVGPEVELYLNNLVDYVNENALWLNPKNGVNRDGDVVGQKPVDSDFDKLMIGPYKESPRSSSQSLNAYMLGVYGSVAPSPVPFQQFLGPFSGLVGGEKPVNLLRKNYELLLQRMKSKNKDLAEGDKKKIEQKLNEYSKASKSLASTLRVLSSYLYYVNAVGDTTRQTNLDENQMKNLTDKYNSSVSSVSSRSVTLLDIFRVIEKIINTGANDGSGSSSGEFEEININ